MTAVVVPRHVHVPVQTRHIPGARFNLLQQCFDEAKRHDRDAGLAQKLEDG